MDYLNKKVKNDKYGIGIIISVDESVFTIQFEKETKSFNYLIAFKNKALVFVNDDEQKELENFFYQKELERIALERKAAELKELREKEENQKAQIKNELKNSVDFALRGEGKKLIGDFEFSYDSIETLSRSFINSYISNNESVNRLSDYDVKCFLIVMINKLREYSKTWNEFPELLSSFFEHISLFDSQSKITALYNRIAIIFNEYERILFRSESGKRAFEQTFLYQALAPKDSVQNFIKLAWCLYLDQDILDSLYEEQDRELCLKVIEALNSKFEGQTNEDDSIQFSGASYGIRAGLRYGCQQNKEKTSELLNRIFEYIYRVDRFNEEITDNYLGYVVTDVINREKQIIVNERIRGERQYSNGYVHSFEQSKPSFYLSSEEHENPKVLLCFPKVMILNSDSNYEFAFVNIYKHFSNEKTSTKVFTGQLQYFKKNETCQTLRAFSVDVTHLLTNFDEDFNIEVVLNVKNEKGLNTYSTSQFLYRDFLVFKENHEIKGTSRPGTFCLISPKNFEPRLYLKLFNNDYRKVLNGIYYFTAKELDLIEYKETKLLFGSNVRSTNVLFVEENMNELKNVFFVPNSDNLEHCVPVYTKFSDIYIENENAVSPSSVRISHCTNDEFDGSVLKVEKNLNDLIIVDRRFFYSATENSLTTHGWHSLEIVKLTALGAKSMLNSPKFEYFFDDQIAITCKELAYLKSDIDLSLKVIGTQNTVLVSCFQTSVDIDTEFGIFRVIPPYIRWKFGQDTEYKHRPVESPFFIDDIPSASVIVFDTSLKINDFIFEDDNTGTAYSVDKSNSFENTFLISQFLMTQRKKGSFYVVTDNYGKLPVLNVVVQPYFRENLLRLTFESGTLLYDFSKAFVHDNKNYKIKMLIGIDELDEPIQLNNLCVDEEAEIEVKNLDDDNYTIELYYYSDYSGIKGNDIKIPLSQDVLMFGDLIKAKFKSRETIVLDKCRISEGNKRSKDNLIYEIKYLFDDGENRIFSALLKTPLLKRNKIIFYADSQDMIRKIFFLNGNEFETKKEGHFDIETNSIVPNEILEGRIYQISSIYIKK